MKWIFTYYASITLRRTNNQTKMSAKSITAKNTGNSVITTTFDCACGLKINKTCPKAVALQKRLHLTKCEAGRILFEEYKKSGEDQVFKYTQTIYNGSTMKKEVIFSNEGTAYGGKCIK